VRLNIYGAIVNEPLYVAGVKVLVAKDTKVKAHISGSPYLGPQFIGGFKSLITGNHNQRCHNWTDLRVLSEKNGFLRKWF
jgi:hypothetical protein